MKAASSLSLSSLDFFSAPTDTGLSPSCYISISPNKADRPREKGSWFSLSLTLQACLQTRNRQLGQARIERELEAGELAYGETYYSTLHPTQRLRILLNC